MNVWKWPCSWFIEEGSPTTNKCRDAECDCGVSNFFFVTFISVVFLLAEAVRSSSISDCTFSLF
jgi:hypothetical protein